MAASHQGIWQGAPPGEVRVKEREAAIQQPPFVLSYSYSYSLGPEARADAISDRRLTSF